MAAPVSAEAVGCRPSRACNPSLSWNAPSARENKYGRVKRWIGDALRRQPAIKITILFRDFEDFDLIIGLI